MKADALRKFETSISDCTRCELGLTRTTFVFGVGCPDARLVFVGEAPGRHEDLQGKPFVGAAGKLLDHLLATIGLARDQVYIANVLKCRPPNNRDPLPAEIELCKEYLKEQLRIIDPVVICTLGNFSTKLILSETRGITQLHGKVFPLGRFKVVPTYHPAAALYTPALQPKLEADFQVVAGVLSDAAGLGPDSPDHGESSLNEEAVEQVEQLHLFF